MGVAAIFVVFCCIIACVISSGNDFNGLVSSSSPGVIRDVWDVSDFPAFTEDGYFLNEIFQPPTSDRFTPVFPMPYEAQALLERSTSFSMRILNSSWSDLVDTNVFHKGEHLYVQVSASPGPGQQLYVQSCFVSSSPNPADKPEVALIINKGCVASKKSLVKFVQRQRDRVNLVLGTSSLKSSEFYLHCRVSLSYLGLTSNTKFCNYNKLKSRWVDLSGQTAVCQCCGRSCRSLSEHEDLLAMRAIVSTGPLIIKDQQTWPQPTPLALSSDFSATTARTTSDRRLIVAGASFSGSSMKNMDGGSPWPVQPGFGGGVMVISQGLGGALSMWLPDLLELQLNPMMGVGIGYHDNPAVVDITLQHDDPFRGHKPEGNEEWQMEQGHFEKSLDPMVEMSKENDHFEAVDPHVPAEDLATWPLEDVTNLYKVQRKPFVTEKVHLQQPKLNKLSQILEFPSNEPLLGTGPPDKATNSTEDEGNFFRQAEMLFKKDKDEKSSEPFLYSKLSLNQAADGSSSLHYEEQKRSMRKPGIRTPHQELEKSQKDEEVEKVFSIKDLVSYLLDQLRELWK